MLIGTKQSQSGRRLPEGRREEVDEPLVSMASGCQGYEEASGQREHQVEGGSHEGHHHLGAELAEVQPRGDHGREDTNEHQQATGARAVPLESV